MESGLRIQRSALFLTKPPCLLNLPQGENQAQRRVPESRLEVRPPTERSATVACSHRMESHLSSCSEGAGAAVHSIQGSAEMHSAQELPDPGNLQAGLGHLCCRHRKKEVLMELGTPRGTPANTSGLLKLFLLLARFSREMATLWDLVFPCKRTLRCSWPPLLLGHFERLLWPGQ